MLLFENKILYIIGLLLIPRYESGIVWVQLPILNFHRNHNVHTSTTRYAPDTSKLYISWLDIAHAILLVPVVFIAADSNKADKVWRRRPWSCTWKYELVSSCDCDVTKSLTFWARPVLRGTHSCPGIGHSYPTCLTYFRVSDSNGITVVKLMLPHTLFNFLSIET